LAFWEENILWDVFQGFKPDKPVMVLDDTILQITRASLSLKVTLIGEEGIASS